MILSEKYFPKIIISNGIRISKNKMKFTEPEKNALWMLVLTNLSGGLTLGVIFSPRVLTLTGFLATISFMIINPIIGVIALSIAELLARVSISSGKWTKEFRLWALSFWPVVFFFWLIFFLPLLMINRD
jgi:hypothetical protein